MEVFSPLSAVPRSGQKMQRREEKGIELGPSAESGSPTSVVKKRFARPDFPAHCYVRPADAAADILAAVKTAQQALLRQPGNRRTSCTAVGKPRRVRKDPSMLCKDTLLDENRTTQHTWQSLDQLVTA